VAGPRQVTATAGVLLAPNPGPMTLEGTNTWVLRAPGEDRCVVVDPGPLDEQHLAAVAAAGPVAVVLLTHAHADHSAGAGRLAELRARLATLPLAERREVPGLHPDRAPTIVAATILLGEVLAAFGLGEFEVSERDILWGVALDGAAPQS